MTTALAVSQLISTAVLIATLVVVIWYTKKTSDMAAATRDMAQASRDQVREANAARYNTQLPILVPGDAFVGVTPPYLSSDAPREAEVKAHQYSDMMNIQNVGPGTAFNVWCCAFTVTGSPSQPHYTMGGLLSLPEVVASGRGTPTYSMHDVTSIPARTTLEDLETRLRVSLAPDPANAPRVRVTLTCTDVFGRKHASIHDFVRDADRRATWRFVAHLHNISEDIPDLHSRYLSPPQSDTNSEEPDEHSNLQ